ncbi:MAG: thiamine pyrophosphate-dependent enzyme [Planctomycetota bacterium]|nr:thiamine pyrophosphate-dependent enzyme [Planctomycetota bacterium]
MTNLPQTFHAQGERNQALLTAAHYMRDRVESHVLPISINLGSEATLSNDTLAAMGALEKRAAATALASLASLAKINELDHLGGGLELIPALLMSMLICDGETKHYTIEHGHTAIGYYSLLAVLGYLGEDHVIEEFRRSIDIPGHVSWVPGGTQLNSGRLGIIVPVAVGQALGLKARHGDEGHVYCHCGDAGWMSGQALNGFIGAAQHGAPITFIMNRNGIQLSDTCKNIMDIDPRTLIGAAGIEILEIPSLHETDKLYAAYREAESLAKRGKSSLIFPVGYTGTSLSEFGDRYGVSIELAEFAGKNNVTLDTKVWVPGSLMSFRDVFSMFENVFFVNGLPGGAAHHDGHMKGRDLAAVLGNPLLKLTDAESSALATLKKQPADVRVTVGRPAPGSSNLVLSKAALDAVELPAAGSVTSPRNGSRIGYGAVAKAFPEQFFTVSCDLDPSTRLDLAKTFIDDNHKFEMGITEQVSSLMVNGMAMSSLDPQLVVFSTFAAFFEGIAREGFELWRYQRNLNGVNEGLNVTMHLSHVGACTGRDHFSGWSLDWISLAIGYLPYLHRFYTPADARSAFVAIKDLAAHYGAHIVGIPRDNVPVLDKQDGSGPLWDQYSAWEPMTEYRSSGAKKAILAVGCTASLGGEAFEALKADGVDVDVHVVNGLPIQADDLAGLATRYPEGIVTIEDGLIGTPEAGLRGFAGLLATTVSGTPLSHVGIADPRIAPSHGFAETWDHFGITTAALVAAVKGLSN